MRNAIALAMAMAAVLTSGCMPLPAGLGASPGASLGPVAPDPNYRPREGDRAVLYALEDGTPMDPMPVLGDMTAYDQFERARASKSSLDQHELEERGWLKWTAPGTRVLILSIRDRSHTGARVGAEVRLLDGAYKDTTAWVPIAYITRFIEVKEE